MKIVIDWELCQGHGVCAGDAPEVFEVSTDGKLKVLQENPPEEFREAIDDAVEFCPTGAIRVVD